jgi:hypothetical protein
MVQRLVATSLQPVRGQKMDRGVNPKRHPVASSADKKVIDSFRTKYHGDTPGTGLEVSSPLSAAQ